MDDALYISGEVGVGGGAIVGGQPLIGSAGTRRRDRPHDGQPRRASTADAAPAAAGRPRSGEDVDPCVAPGYPPHAGAAGVEQVIAEAHAGSPEALAALDEVGRWLGIGLGALVNILNPRMIVLGGVHARMYPVIREVVDAEVARRSLRGAARRGPDRAGQARRRCAAHRRVGGRVRAAAR